MSEWLREVEHAGYSVQYAGTDSEQTPLLNPNLAQESNVTWGRIFWIFFFVVIFCSGLIIGIYLLLEDDCEYLVTQPLLYINKLDWGATSAKETLTNYSNPIAEIAIAQTSTNNCDTLQDCAEIIRNLQKNHTSTNKSDLPYNFILAGDGAIYKIRGWRFNPSIGDHSNRTAVIAFLGNFTEVEPSKKQIREYNLFIDEWLKQGMLDICFNLTLIDNNVELFKVFNKLVEENNHRKSVQISCK